MSLASTPRSTSIFSHKFDYGDSYVRRRSTLSSYDELEKENIYTEGDIKILKTIDLNGEGMCCKFTENGDKIAVGLSNGDIKIFQAFSGDCVYHLSDDDVKSNRLPVTSLHFLQNSDSNKGIVLIATYVGGMIKFWHISTSTALQTIRESCQFLTSSISPTSLSLAAGGSPEEIFVYDVVTGKKMNTCSASPSRLVMDGHRSRILAIKYHPNDRDIFLSGGWDDTIQFWDQREQHSIRSLFGPHICGEGIDIDDANNQILTASWRKHEVLQVWDYKTGTKIKTIPSDFTYDSFTSGMICNLPSGVYSVDHDRQRVAQKQINLDVTMIVAVAGRHLYFVSNAVNSTKKEEPSP